jgi:hypothetical protein
MSKSSYATNEELLEQIADDLVQMHYETGIDLAYWSTGLEIVRRFYNVEIQVEVGSKHA